MVKIEKRSPRKSKETLSYRRAAAALILSFFLFVLLLLFGVQGLAKLASFLGGIKDSGAPIEKTEEELLLPPRLATLPIATNSAQISVSGFAESSFVVEIFLNDVLIDSTLVSKEGKFEIHDLVLEKGENKIYAFTKSDNKRSSASKTINIAYKEKPPNLEIISPDDETTISGEDKKVKIKGQTDPEVSLFINNRWVIVKNDGSFSFELPLSEGENEIEIIARDIAGNETKKTLLVKYHH